MAKTNGGKTNGSGGFVVGGQWGLGASTGAIMVGALALGGLALALHLGHKKHRVKQSAVAYAYEAAQKISPEGLEDEMFDTVLSNADRPATVVDNEDRVRHSIRGLWPHMKELVGNYINGGLSYEELIRECRAATQQIHKDLDIPVRMGNMEDFFPSEANHPRRHGHRMHKMGRKPSPIAKHIKHDGDVYRDEPDGMTWPWFHENHEPKKHMYGDLDLAPFDDARKTVAYPATVAGWIPPGQVGRTPRPPMSSPIGWERGRYNPHDLTSDPNMPYGQIRRSNAVALLPNGKPFPLNRGGQGHHYGWGRGRGNPHEPFFGSTVHTS